MQLRALSLVVCVVLGQAAGVRAQAWSPPKGEGTAGVTYQNYYVTGHFDPRGQKNKNGATHTKALIAEIDYGITDSIALTISLPFIASKYTGPEEYFVGGIRTTPGPLDDRRYHGAFQDLRIEGRRVFVTGPVSVAPFVAVTIPTHDYETVGEAVPGRHRREFHVGASAGVPLDGLIPGAYAHVRYMYAAAQRVDNIPFTRSNIDFEAGQALSSRISVRGLVQWQNKHRGPAVPDLAHDWVHHDRFIAPDFLNAGVGTSIAVTRSTEIYAVWIATVSGRNGAHVGRLLSVGTAWSFGRGFGGLGGRATPARGWTADSRRPTRIHAGP